MPARRQLGIFCSPLITLSHTLILVLLLANCYVDWSHLVAVAAVPADQAPIFAGSPNPNPSYAPISPSFLNQGPTLCPLVSSCHCKWTNGKQIASCEKRNLANIPSQLPQDTQVLEMSHNNLVRLQAHIFQDKLLTNLQKIYLSECKISSVSDEAFAHLTNLIELDLSHNQLQQVPVRSFERLNHSLRKLSLAFNPIQTIESDAFTSLNQLTTLDLSYSHISQLKPGTFHGLTQLKELKLNDNRLTQLPMAVMMDLNEYLIIDLQNNPWHCDCELRQSIDHMTRHHFQQSIVPTCSSPPRHKDIRWHNVKQEEFICPPQVINKQNEMIVGAGSNVTLTCSARGSPPLTFVWFQDEKNLTTNRGNSSEPPASTKLLEEKRYEIAEELSGPPGNPGNLTTSILYLFNLKLTDTSLFLCWVENAAGYTIANFSLTVNDSPPTHNIGFGSGLSADIVGHGPLDNNALLGRLGLSQTDAFQVGIISVGFILISVTAIAVLLMFKQSSRRSSKNSQSSDLKSHPAISHPTHLTIIASANKFSQANNLGQRSMLADSEEDDDEDTDASSASSCRKGAAKNIIAPEDLGGFIEHMRSGIINMDYHSMSPVIQFNNTLKKNGTNNQNKLLQQAQQNNNGNNLNNYNSNQKPLPYLDTTNQEPMHHFQSASNASSIPYFIGGNGAGRLNGSASLATTTSDLSPSSGGSNGSGNTLLNNQHFAHTSMNGPPNLTNCDLQAAHQLNNNGMIEQLAPATNTTTTSYTSDYQSGYSEDPSIVGGGHQMMPPQYSGYDPHSTAGAYPVHHHQLNGSNSMFASGGLVVGPPTMRPGSSMVQQQQDLVMQDMIQNHRHSLLAQQQQQNNQRLHLGPGYQILRD